MIYVLSGGPGLNFRILGGTAQPSGPVENTIWVNTATSITGWVFAPEAPASPAAGMVWFQTGIGSHTAFNALKKNGIEILPVGCKQYVSGAWVTKTARTYQDGAWVDWYSGELYANGNPYTDVTGGWKGNNISALSDDQSTASVMLHADSMDITVTDGGGSAQPVNKIDLTEYNTLELELSWLSGGAHTYDALYVCEAFVNPYRANCAAKADAWGSKTTVTLDISALKGKYYVGIGLLQTNGSKTLRVHRLQLKR